MSESPTMPVYRNPADYGQEPVLQSDIYSTPERQQLAHEALAPVYSVDTMVQADAQEYDPSAAEALEQLRAARVIGDRLQFIRDNQPVVER